MISGVHVILYSTRPEADRAFFRDILCLNHVDAGEGWSIFGLPPAEIAVHPADESGEQAVYLLCEDIGIFTAEMASRNIPCTPVRELSWGRLVQITLPGGGTLGVYEPRHARPKFRRGKSGGNPQARPEK